MWAPGLMPDGPLDLPVGIDAWDVMKRVELVPNNF